MSLTRYISGAITTLLRDLVLFRSIVRVWATLSLLLVIATGQALAAGTPAGTRIVNQARVEYRVGEQSYAETSNITSTVVVELLDVDVSWQDLGSVPVSPGDRERMLVYRLTNTGNGRERFALSVEDELPGDDFDPNTRKIYLDSNDSGALEPGEDQLYWPPNEVGTREHPLLERDASLLVFVLGDIPERVADGDEGYLELAAEAVTGSGEPGTLIPGAGDEGTDAVVGFSGADDEAIGGYSVTTVTVSVQKTATVADPLGGAEAMPGAIITYTIEVAVNGSGLARDLLLTDPVPEHTTYRAGSLTYVGTVLSEELDDDAGDVNVTRPGEITVFLGDVAAGEAPRIVSFSVTIN